jgi:ABC-2 type transport system permease protein
VSATLRAEWTKLRTLRSTTLALLLLGTVSILFSALATSESETMGGSPGHPGDNDVVLDTLAGVFFGQLGIIALAVLAITSEYSTGLIRTTLAANPRRRTVLAAKTAIVGVTALVAGLATSVACFYLGQRILQSNGFTHEHGYPGLSLADGLVFRAVFGTAVYLAAIAVLALGIGTLLRHTAASITLVLALVLGPVIAIGFLPEHIAERVEQASLMPAGLAIQQTVVRDDNIPLDPGMAFAVVGAYAAVALALAFWAISRRDA